MGKRLLLLLLAVLHETNCQEGKPDNTQDDAEPGLRSLYCGQQLELQSECREYQRPEAEDGQKASNGGHGSFLSCDYSQPNTDMYPTPARLHRSMMFID